MTHIAITPQLDGTAVNWMEKVADDEYFGRKGAPFSQQRQAK